ncbi:hypothetical protein B5P43_35535 [Bacillus sp. SRB_336]|nr:hypothetical protein B5P43_35535 [Bacillus sp. SRB_336]
MYQAAVNMGRSSATTALIQLCRQIRASRTCSTVEGGEALASDRGGHSHRQRPQLFGRKVSGGDVGSPEALEDGVADDVHGYHQRIIAQADQMAVLVNDLLELSKIQAGALVLNRQQLDLYDLVSDAIADLAPVAAHRGIAINGDAVVRTSAAIDGASLGRAIRNLILNGILYSKPGSTVDIAVRSGDGWALVAVEDGCGGISTEDLGHLFTPGWQKDAGRTKSRYSGAGVGLSVVAGIVQAHRGSVDVANVDGGCRFTLQVPVS